MQDFFQPFYRSFYAKTGGFIPTIPSNQHIYPGDFFQIKNGEIVLLGNIYQSQLVIPENIQLEYSNRLNPANWSLNEGAKRNLSIDTDVSGRLILNFDKKGSFYFSANNPESVRIENWREIQDELIIKMTQTYYSFRELYLVTEVAMPSGWRLAVAGADDAELEIVNDEENFGLLDIFGHSDSKTVRSENIEYYHNETKKKTLFWKAKKLVVTDHQQTTFYGNLINSRDIRPQWANSFFEFDVDTDEFSSPQPQPNSDTTAIDMLQGNQLNPNTALQYFRWTDANMDDIARLF